jgi:hypothetical protein
VQDHSAAVGTVKPRLLENGARAVSSLQLHFPPAQAKQVSPRKTRLGQVRECDIDYRAVDIKP